jgi:hypothetical protein
MIKDDKELNDVVCAAYKMGCDQTREVYQKRIEKLEAALRQYTCDCESPCDEHLTDPECGMNARKALEEKDD